MLEGVVKMVRYMAGKSTRSAYNDPPLLALYYNGKTLRTISANSMVEVVDVYERKIRHAWNE